MQTSFPLLTRTSPVGWPAPGGVTVKDARTFWPRTDGSGSRTSRVWVPAGLTACRKGADWLVWKSVSPRYEATSVLFPLVVKVSWQLPARIVALQEWTPSLTLTRPDGVPGLPV